MIGRFLCKYLKWHKPNNIIKHDEVNSHSTCKYCDKSIMQDSQGNWF
jgi:hypothetical protein